MAAEETFVVPGFANLKVIGAGGNSRVYSGTRIADQRDIVLKVKILDDSKHKHSEIISLINHRIYGLKEYDIGSYLDCDFIAKYISYNTTSKYIYTVMEHEEGSMTAYKRSIKLPFQEKVSLLKKILIGLHECHKQGILHLDMKFENVLIRSRERSGMVVNEPLLTDFGFSLRVRSVKSGTFVRNRFGTAGYLAPEQFPSYHHHKEDRYIYRGAHDIWAYGIIAYRLLLEDRVYQSNDGELIQQEMVKYFQQSNVKALIAKRKSPFYESLSKDDKADVIELLSATLAWDYRNRLNTRGLLDLPIFQKSAKIKVNCGVSESSKRSIIRTNSKILPVCLEYLKEVAMTCSQSQIIIYYHMVDLVYRVCSINPFALYKPTVNNARSIVVSCMLIALNYHFAQHQEYEGIVRYIRDVHLVDNDLISMISLIVKNLKAKIYRRGLYESVFGYDDMANHIKNIIPDPEKYVDFKIELVDANPINSQNYDLALIAYATIDGVFDYVG